MVYWVAYFGEMDPKVALKCSAFLNKDFEYQKATESSYKKKSFMQTLLLQ